MTRRGSKKPNPKKLHLQSKFDDLSGLIEELANESDRASAIVASAFLDEHLRDFLIHYFVDDADASESLLSNERPLGTFGARIRLFYSLGFASKKTLKALLLIKDMRNDFAHDLHGRSFDDPDIKAKCKKLYALSPFNPKSNITPRKMYHVCVVMLLGSINVATVKLNEERCQVPTDDWFSPDPSITLEPTVSTTTKDGRKVSL